MTVPDPSSLPSVTIRLDGNGVPLPFLQLGGEPDDASSARKSLLAFTADVSALARAVGAAVTDRTDARAYQVYQVGKAFHALAQKILGLFDGLQLLVDYHLIFRMVAGLETSGIVGYREFGLQRACRDLQHPPRSAQNGHGGYPGLTHSQLLAVAYGLDIQRRVKPDRSIQASQDWEAALDSLARARENVVELCLLLKEAVNRICKGGRSEKGCEGGSAAPCYSRDNGSLWQSVDGRFFQIQISLRGSNGFSPSTCDGGPRRPSPTSNASH
jgi:hypothetical protein